MKKFCLIIILLLSAVSCRSIKEVPVKTETVIRERAVPIAIPESSANMQMRFECDSLFNVILKYYNEQKTAGVETSFNQSGNDIEIGFKTKSDTIYMIVADTTTVKDKPVVVEVEKKTGGKWASVIWGIVIAILTICVTVILSIFFGKKNGIILRSQTQ